MPCRGRAPGQTAPKVIDSDSEVLARKYLHLEFLDLSVVDLVF